ncbi:MAG: extracellular solute-binding protein [Armatimonadetes bacterium]|nr:extracellular solute-binding protein [Armatimonadota bacterium]
MKKIIFYLIIFSICINFSWAQSLQNKINLNFWHALSPDEAIILNKLIDKFSKEYPQYLIIPKNFNSKEALKYELLTSTQSPEIALIDTTWQKELILRDKLTAVENLMENAGSMIKVVYKLDTPPAIWNACIYQGKAYTLPFFALNQALICNKEIFDKEKVKKIPASWDDLIKLAKNLNKPERKQFGFSLPLKSQEMAGWFQVVLWQFGGEIYKINEEKISLNDSLTEKALQFYYDLYKKYNLNPLNEQDLSKTAMFLGNSAELLKLEKEGYKCIVAPLPSNKNNKKINNMTVASLAVFKGKYAEKSWNFIYYLSEFPQSLEWVLATPYLPANKLVPLSPQYFSFLQEHPGMRIFLQQLVNSKTNPPVANYDKILNDLGIKIQETIKGVLTIKEALNQADESANQTLNEKI